MTKTPQVGDDIRLGQDALDLEHQGQIDLLKQVITGFFNYHPVPTNWAALGACSAEVIRSRPTT